MRTRRRLLLLALVGVWLGGFDAVSAAPARLAILCEDVCDSGASCGAECWLTQFEFDQDYPPTSCGAEEYSCCGDGMCDVAVEGCSSATCEADCGSMPICDDDGPTCPTGQVLTGTKECVPYSPDVPKPGGGTCGGECTSDSDCCDSTYCFGDEVGQGYCAVSSTLFCQNAPSCTGVTSADCQEWADESCSGTAHDVYCDPGINRCLFNQGTECPSSSNVCTFAPDSPH